MARIVTDLLLDSPSFCDYLSDHAQQLSDLLRIALQQGNTTYARLPSAEQEQLVGDIVVALREVVIQQRAAPLLELMRSVPLGDVHPLYGLIQRSVFAIATPYVTYNPAAGMRVLESIATTLSEITAVEAERRVNEAQALTSQQLRLYDLACEVTVVASLSELVDVVVGYVEPLGAERCILLTFEEQHEDSFTAGVVAASWQRHSAAPSVFDQRFELAHTPFNQIVLADQLWLIEDSAHDQSIDEHTRQALLAAEQLSLLSAPLLLRGRLIGRLLVTWPTPRHFTPYESQLINTVAYQAPAVAERLQLLDATQRQLDIVARLRESLEREVAARTADLRTFYALAENAPDGIAVADLDGRLTYANTAFQAMTGYGTAAIGMAITGFSIERIDELRALTQSPLVTGSWQGILTFHRADGSRFPGQLSAFVIRDAAGAPQGLAAIVRDMTEHIRDQQERLALQAQIIDAQGATLRELSTPVIPLTDQIVAMPLIGRIDSVRAQQIMEALLAGVAAKRATTVILDITGIPVVDTHVAGMLVRAVQAVTLLGTQALLTGMRPEVAQTLVGLGVDLKGITTCATIQSGIALALAADTPGSAPTRLAPAPRNYPPRRVS